MATAKILHLPHAEAELPSEPNEVIEDYLDHLCGPLIGIVPYERRQRLRLEAQTNIQECADRYELDGLTPLEAAMQAVDKYGHTDALSETIIEEWMNGLPKGTVARKIGLPMSYAAFFFIQANLWGLILLQYRLFFPDSNLLNFGLSIPELRKIWPEPLPLPEQGIPFAMTWFYCFLAPIVAGWLTGRKALTGAARSVTTVQTLLLILTFVVGTFMLPMTDGLVFALIQIVWWVPIGTLTAHVASALARRRRFRFQPVWRKKSI